MFEMFVDVIVPLQVEGVYTYAVPYNWQHVIDIGKRVVVNFGKSKIYTGIIVHIHQQQPNYKVKEIISVLDDKPIVYKHHLELWEWISRYYLCPLGIVMKNALPTGLKLESESIIIPGELYEQFEPKSEEEKIVKKILDEKQTITLAEIQSALPNKNVRLWINRLARNNFIQIEESLANRYVPKLVDYVNLAFEIESEDQLNAIFKKLSRSPKQSDILLAFFALNNSDFRNATWIRKEDLLEAAKADTSSLKRLVDKNILIIKAFEESRIFTKQKAVKIEKKSLSEVQLMAYDKINELFEQKDVVLLHGVTSSGKTEIYIHLIEQFVNQGKQVLFLMPEIALTSQMIKRLQKNLGNKVAVYHSKYSDNERTELFLHIAQSDEPVPVVLGVRSSLFLPFKNLGLIIVDEEHEYTYKQNTEPYYHARDTAIMMAKLYGAKVLLGSATPSLESYFNATSGKYGYVELTQKFYDVAEPEIKVIDLKKERQKGNVRQEYFTDDFLNLLRNTLNEKKQTIVFQNRRGYSPYLECDVCGWIPGCKYCDVKLTYHKSLNKLICHYCGYSELLPDSCPDCGQSDIKIRGLGTERIEDELKTFFEDLRVIRIDLDTTRTRNKIEELFSKIENNEVDVIVGTQMVTKGLDFDNVAFVAIPNADSILNYPDFRSYERAFQLFLQVIGRAGRRLHAGTILIQTINPQNPIFKYILHQDYHAFAKWQLVERNSFKYPPYFRLIKVELKHKDFQVLKKRATEIYQNLTGIKNIITLKPNIPIVGKINNYYIMNIWIKMHRNSSLRIRDDIYLMLYNFFKKPENKSLKWIVDVDPY